MRFTILVFALLVSSLAASPPVTLRSLGAKGDGKTDDRAAIQTALQSHPGESIDGEGLTYAVNGSISVTVDVDLKNLTLQQIQGSFDTSKLIRSTKNSSPPSVRPPEALTRMINGVPWLRADGIASYPEDPLIEGADLAAIREMVTIRTLFIRGTEQKPVSIQLENVQVLRGDHPEAGMHSNSAGLYLVLACPLTLTNVDISGDGKGAGLMIDLCRKVRLDKVNIHDILWAPYPGDVNFTAEELGIFGWNNSPLYDYSERDKRFVRVRIQEPLTGLQLVRSEDVEIIRSRIERLGTKVEGKFVPWQADGATISGVKNLVLRDCEISQVWEGIDFTGRGVDGFVQENIHIRDTFSYGFKYAHPQKNGKVIHCVSERAGYRSFTIGSETENVEFVNCIARETGVDSHWKRPGRAVNGIAGFDVGFDSTHFPRNIVLKDCVAENIEFPGEMDFGFSTSDLARKPELGIRLIHPLIQGAKVRPVDGFRVE